MHWMIYGFMPTILFIACVGCDRNGADIDSHLLNITAESTSYDSVFPLLRVECNLSLVWSEQKIVAKLIFKNISKIPIGIPHYKIIADGRMTRGSFEVLRGDYKMPYRCVMAKRFSPTDADRIYIDSGGTYSSQTTISECYDFSIPGQYLVQYRESIHVPNCDELLEIVSNSVMLTVQ